MGTVYEETGQQFEVSDEGCAAIGARVWRSPWQWGIVLINACGLCITNGFPEIPW